MSESHFSNNSETLSKGAKAAVYGLSATAIAIFSYYIYAKYFKEKRNGSQSSDSADDTHILNSLNKKGTMKMTSPLNLKKKRSSPKRYERTDSGKIAKNGRQSNYISKNKK